jgi:hypothetical protein
LTAEQVKRCLHGEAGTRRATQSQLDLIQKGALHLKDVNGDLLAIPAQS